MIPDEYLPPQPPQSRRVRRPHTVPSVAGIDRSTWLQIGALVLIVGVGSALLGLCDPDTIKARVLMGVAGTSFDEDGGYSFLKKHYVASDNVGNTVAICENLVRLKPTDARARVFLGDAYAGIGRTYEARASYQEALRLDADCFEAHLGMGKLQVELGHHPEAIESYRRALRIRPDSADAHLSLGLALSNAGQYDGAMQAFARAKELDPALTETQVLTGKAYLQAGMYTRAIECLESAVHTDQRHAQAYFNLGRAYLRVGDRGLAMRQQHILQNLNPQLADQLLQLIESP